MATLTREQILARKLGKGTVTFADGSQVHIRPLTRDEVLAMAELETATERDHFVVATGMTDPQLSMEDVAHWAANDAAGDLSAVSEGIAVISGMTAGAGKEATKSASRRR